MSKIIVNSQGPHSPNGVGVNTGFSKVGYGIVTALAEQHDVGWLCNEHQGLDFTFSASKAAKSFKILRGNKNFTESASELKLHVETRKPDYVIGVGEAWAMYPYKDIKFGNTELMMHIPVDGDPLDKTLEAIAPMADLIIPASHYGAKVLEINGLGGSHVIPHSYDPNTYKPYKQKQRDEARTEMGLTNEFVVGFVGRQQDRKNTMALVVAFAKFAEGKDDVRLMLDVTIDKYADYNMIHLIQFLGLGRKVFMLKRHNHRESEMANLYNAMDVYFTTTCSEGFNLPVLEAQACGVPCIATNYSAHVELIRGHGQLINVADYRPMPNGINWAYVDINDAVEKLQYYYDNRSAVRRDGAAAQKFVSEFYTKPVVDKLWVELIEKYDDVKEMSESKKPVRRMDVNVE